MTQIHADSPGQAVYIVRHEQADIFDETWEAIGSLEGSRAIYRVSFEDVKHRCAWVRIAKDTNCLHVARFLVYGHRRS